MPTSASATFSAASRLDPLLMPPGGLLVENVALAASTVYPKGTILGEITASPGTYAAYASGNADGTQTPRGILQYGVTTDSAGAAVLIGEQGASQKFFPMLLPCKAVYKTSELVGLDANAVTKLGAVLVEGTTSSGQVSI